jgi:hypothetical protein
MAVESTPVHDTVINESEGVAVAGRNGGVDALCRRRRRWSETWGR